MEINELYQLARRNERQAKEDLFAALRARFELFVRQRVGSQAEAEDVVQEALKTILEKYRSIEFESSFSGWAYQVLNNKLMTTVATRSRRRDKLAEAAESETHSHEETRPAGLERRLLECLRSLNRVNRRHARILNLHYLGYAVDEICTKLELTRSNFYSILSRARSQLQKCLKEGGFL